METVTARTFTPFYDEMEDRIILVINYEDVQNRVDLMITRNFILKILPALDEFILRYCDENISTVTQTTQQEQSTDNTLTKTNTENLTFYAKEKELLNELNLSYLSDKAAVSLKFSTSKTTIQAVLGCDAFAKFIQALKSSIPNISWGIAMHF